MKRLVIIDGNAIIHRAYHALPPLTTKDGQMVNAVYGFTSMLLRVWNDLRPTHVAVTFDVAGGTFRHDKYDRYKATRVKADQELYDQIPLAHEVVAALGLPVYERRGYEADDVIGTIVERVSKQKKNDTEIFIVTGDMDTLQLVRPGVQVYTLRKGLSDVVVYDSAAVRERFGFGPEHMVDYKALRGDTSDNIPGVPGIGEKTASELIQKFGTIAKLYARVKKDTAQVEKDIKPGVLKKLRAGEESALMSYDLARIDGDVPDLNFSLTDCALREIDHDRVSKVFQKFEFVSLLKRLPGATKEPVSPRQKKISAKDFDFTEAASGDTSSVIAAILEAKQFAARAVLNGKDVLTSEWLGLVVVVGGKSFYFKGKLGEEWVKLFAAPEVELVGHDLKQLVKALKAQGVEVSNRLFDVMIASYLLSPGSRAHDSASVILKVLGKELTASSNQESLFGIDARAWAQELFMIAQTADKLRAELKKIDDYGLFEKVEMPLVAILAQMEMNGIAVDTAQLRDLAIAVARDIKKVSRRIYKLAGREFNISSPLQLREVLFDELDIPVAGVKKGKTGLSTSAEELEKLRGLHPIIDEISNYRELAKLQNTYIDVLPTLINKKTGRIHSNFNQAVTATGRLSSSDPNLQNIPIRTPLGREIRKAFVAPPGYLLVSADYSQIELRIVASLARDRRMMEIFDNDEDIHRATAAAINEVPLDQVTKEMRRAAKEINFGILYGMGAYGLAWRAEIPQWQAKQFIDKYFEQFAGVKKYLDTTLAFTRKEGYCETLFGRRRYIPELLSGNYQLRAAAERMAINHPVQGTAADLMKMAMIEVDKQLHHQWSAVDGPKLVLQVHDELVFEAKEAIAHELADKVKTIMEGVVKLRVPVKVETSIHPRWGEMK